MRTLNEYSIRLTALALFGLLGGCLSDAVVTNDVSASPDPGGTANRAPNIVGNPPPAVRVGDQYSFTPQASDPDGDTLTFTIDNKPAWAIFDSSTGEVSGAPTLGDIGSYPNIRVSVSDGQLSTSTSGFTIDVTQDATSSVSLSWTAPTQNSDGSVLTDLAGFKIYYGRSSGSYTNQIRIDNPSVSTYVIENLTPDTYYFVGTSFNTSGIESEYSNEAQRQVL